MAGVMKERDAAIQERDAAQQHAAEPDPPPPPPPALGATVRIHSLLSRPELNGILGTVFAVYPDEERVGVRVRVQRVNYGDEPFAVISFKASNLAILADAVAIQAELGPALLQGNSFAIEAWLDSGDSHIDAEDEGGSTLLMGASFYGNDSIVAMLIGRRADVNRQNSRGGTALMNAANPRPCVDRADSS